MPASPPEARAASSPSMVGQGRRRWRGHRRPRADLVRFVPIRRTAKMDSRFAELVGVMDKKADLLLSMQPVTRATLPPPERIPLSGVYLFSEGQSHMYVGRTRRLRRRLIEHSSPQLLDAPF